MSNFFIPFRTTSVDFGSPVDNTSNNTMSNFMINVIHQIAPGFCFAIARSPPLVHLPNSFGY